MRSGPGHVGKRGTSFKPGDYVLLTQDEPDANPTAFQGDWGRVIRASGTAVDIQLAGHGRARGAALDRVLGMPAWCVVACDHHGRPVPVVQDRIRPATPATPGAPAAALAAAPPRHPGRMAWLLGAGALGCVALMMLVLR